MRRRAPLLGGIFLISGTSIGAGVLALPVKTGSGGFFPSLMLFVVLWGVMLATAYFLLDVNLKLKGELNLFSMAAKMLGPIGKWSACVLYVLLLYALLAAYLSACSPLFVQGIELLLSWRMPDAWSFFILPMLFGCTISLGIASVDYVNRILMLGLLVSYVLLIGALPGHMDLSRLMSYDMAKSFTAAPLILTAFGYHIIIPTLTTYMHHQVSLLRKALWIGSLIPLVVCVLWQLGILAAVPKALLLDALVQGVPATTPLESLLKTTWMQGISSFFAFFALVTSFLGVSLSLSDFLIDALSLKKGWEGRLLATLLTFIPPLFVLLSCTNAFYFALDYAGAFVALLLGVLPACMVLRFKRPSWYAKKRGRILIISVLLIMGIVVGIDLAMHF